MAGIDMTRTGGIRLASEKFDACVQIVRTPIEKQAIDLRNIGAFGGGSGQETMINNSCF